jgi:ribosomal protein S18 acetylase RimI-like enzyme
MQFGAQDAAWREARPAMAMSVIEVDGEPAGRLYVDTGPDETRIVDIALLPEFRGRGVGGGLVREIIAAGEARGASVTIHVERENRARSLYERLGFEPVSTTGVYDLLERRPQAKTAS